MVPGAGFEPAVHGFTDRFVSAIGAHFRHLTIETWPTQCASSGIIRRYLPGLLSPLLSGKYADGFRHLRPARVRSNPPPLAWEEPWSIPIAKASDSKTSVKRRYNVGDLEDRRGVQGGAAEALAGKSDVARCLLEEL
jgi:hypothetical protein